LILVSRRTGVPVDPIELYASAIDTSDYVERVVPVIRAQAPVIGDLLDVGAGGGQLGRALREPGRQWTAIEPSVNMRARLAQIEDGPRIVGAGWESANIPRGGHDTVLAATIGGLVQQTGALLARCRFWARRTIVWVVAAHNGPRGLVFAGCLPAEWHGEDETPAIDLVLRNLPPAAQPHAMAMADWTFSAVVSDLEELANYLADRLGWGQSDSRRREMADHLNRQAKPETGGYRLDIPRKSAILVWGHPWVGIRVS
jgi:hypothetical protein